jgi:hypothetical protein
MLDQTDHFLDMRRVHSQIEQLVATDIIGVLASLLLLAMVVAPLRQNNSRKRWELRNSAIHDR